VKKIFATLWFLIAGIITFTQTEPYFLIGPFMSVIGVYICILPSRPLKEDSVSK